jgi:hypothetical protein
VFRKRPKQWKVINLVNPIENTNFNHLGQTVSLSTANKAKIPNLRNEYPFHN